MLSVPTNATVQPSGFLGYLTDHLTPRKRFTPAASVVTRDGHDRCTVPGCIRRPHHWGAAFCSKHAQRAFENGHVEATVATIRELAVFAPWIDYGLRLYHNTPAVRIALARSTKLLRYEPQRGEEWERYLAGRMSAVRAKAGIPVDARRLLITVLCYFAFEAAYPERVMSRDVHDIGLARSLIRLGKCKQPAPRKSNLVPCGAYIASELGRFAITFLDLLKRRTRADNIKREREDAALVDFTES
jgi:hypothetical protein